MLYAKYWEYNRCDAFHETREIENGEDNVLSQDKPVRTKLSELLMFFVKQK